VSYNDLLVDYLTAVRDLGFNQKLIFKIPRRSGQTRQHHVNFQRNGAMRSRIILLGYTTDESEGIRIRPRWEKTPRG